MLSTLNCSNCSYLPNSVNMRIFALYLAQDNDKPIMKLTSTNVVAIRLIYIITWSLGLLWATFPKVLSGKFDFHLSELCSDTLRSEYTFPLFTVLMLYLWDVIYDLAKEKAETNIIRGEKIVFVLIALVIFLFCYLLSISMSNPSVTCALFWLIWTAMTSMKVSTTKKIELKPIKVPQGTCILDN